MGGRPGWLAPQSSLLPSVVIQSVPTSKGSPATPCDLGSHRAREPFSHSSEKLAEVGTSLGLSVGWDIYSASGRGFFRAWWPRAVQLLTWRLRGPSTRERERPGTQGDAESPFLTVHGKSHSISVLHLVIRHNVPPPTGGMSRSHCRRETLCGHPQRIQCVMTATREARPCPVV